MSSGMVQISALVANAVDHLMTRSAASSCTAERERAGEHDFASMRIGRPWPSGTVAFL